MAGGYRYKQTCFLSFPSLRGGGNSAKWLWGGDDVRFRLECYCCYTGDIVPWSFHNISKLIFYSPFFFYCSVYPKCESVVLLILSDDFYFLEFWLHLFLLDLDDCFVLHNFCIMSKKRTMNEVLKEEGSGKSSDGKISRIHLFKNSDLCFTR